MSEVFENNNLLELKALVEGEESDGYGAMRIHSSREILDSWYGVADENALPRDVVPLAWNYFCRYVYKTTQAQNSDPLTRHQLRCLINTCFYLAIKVHSAGEESLVASHLAVLRALAHERDVLTMEQKLLEVLEWLINPPTMHQFILRLSELHPLASSDSFSGNYIEQVARYQAECAVYHSELMMNYRPSVIAFAAIMRAEEEVDPRVLTDNMRDEFASYQSILKMDICEVGEAMSALENLIPRVPIPAEISEGLLPQVDGPTRWTGTDGSISPNSVADTQRN